MRGHSDGACAWDTESGAFDDLRKLERLEISGNPFMCDCNLAWFLRWLEARESMLSNALKTR